MMQSEKLRKNSWKLISLAPVDFLVDFAENFSSFLYIVGKRNVYVLEGFCVAADGMFFGELRREDFDG